MPVPNTREYASRVIKRSMKHGVISGAGSASSCPSSSSSSSSGSDAEIESGTAARAQAPSSRRRRLLRMKYSLKAGAASHTLPSLHFVVPHEKSRDKALVVIPGFLRRKKIQKMEAIFRASPSSYIINDRKSDLVYVAALPPPPPPPPRPFHG